MGKRIAFDNYKVVNKKKKKNAADLNNKSSSEESSSEDEESSDISLTEISIKYKESPKPEFQLTQDLVNGVILTDLSQKQWRIGKPIGKGSFGEIFLASDNINSSITNENAKYVVKIEPHLNGPLFVEIHCLLNTAKGSVDEPLPLGMPEYIASGSHYFRDIRYRFLILPRYDRDLHSIIKNRRVDQKSVLILAIQILDILQHIHNKGYCHSDIKAENLMIGKCTYSKKLQKKYDEKINKYNYGGDTEYNEKEIYEISEDSYCEDEDNEDDSEYNSYRPVKKLRNNQTPVQYSGSNPVRSCRTNKSRNPQQILYQEMLSSHYLRPAKKINYSEFFNDENSKSSYNDDYSCTIDDYISNHRLNINNKNTKKSSKKIQYISQKLNNDFVIDENHIYLIDFGLASKFIDSNGLHRPFCMDQRRAHDGTLEFTSRDAHMGAHSRRSDLECLGYNLIFWSQGYLPWKEKTDKQQHEKVHWMKEYFMTDVKEMLKHIYGKQVPKYLGDFMDYVGKLSYDERPNYIKFKLIFQRELDKLNIKPDKWQLNINEMIENSIDINDEIENNNFKEMKNIKSIMKNLGVLMPFRENNTNNRVSPKNLRSKSDKNSKKKKKKFSWAEILSQNPDQIARERAEKEYEREQTIETPINRYQGKPTYAILEMQKRIKFKDRLELLHTNDIDDEEDEQIEFYCKGYTKPMIDIFKKRQANRFSSECIKKQQQEQLQSLPSTNQLNSNKKNSKESAKRTRAKEGLRTIITPTKRGLDYNHSINIQKTRRQQNLFMKKSNSRNNNHHNNNTIICVSDESSSCSSNLSVDSSSKNSAISSNKSELSAASNSTISNKRIRRYQENGSSGNSNSNSSSILSNGNGGATSSSFQVSISDEDTRDVMVVFNPKRTRYAVKKTKIKLNGSSIKDGLTPPITIVVSSQNNSSNKLSRGDKNVSRRKKSVPRKRNLRGEFLRCV